MDPGQEIFTKIRRTIIDLGYDVYDGHLPQDGTPYPFVYLGQTDLDDTNLKTAVFGSVTQVVDVWSNQPEKRGSLSEMMLAIKAAVRKIYKTEHFTWMITGINQTILADSTTAEPLLHGVLTISLKFS